MLSGVFLIMSINFLHTEYPVNLQFSVSKQKTRAGILLFLLVLVPVGLCTKIYQGPAAEWVHHYAGDIFYPMFWYFLGVLIFPHTNPLAMCLVVFAFSTTIEFTQLLNGWPLAWLRQSFWGRTLVGVSFSGVDIFYYYFGSLAAVVTHGLLDIYLLPAPAFEPQGHQDSL